jgi:hypothetical protein
LQERVVVDGEPRTVREAPSIRVVDLKRTWQMTRAGNPLRASV